MAESENFPRKILITGGAGFIGSAIVRDLAAAGCEVFVVDDLSFGRRELAQVPDTHFSLTDILDREKLIRVISGFQPDWILHLAAVHFIPWCNEHPYRSADINIRGTMHVLEAASRCTSLKGFLFASTAAVYPVFDGPLSETHATAPTDIYGLSKLAGEELCLKFHLQTGVPTVVCRFFNAFGPNETNPHLIPEIQKQVNAGATAIRLGNLEPKRDFIHTSDMSAAVLKLLGTFKNGYDVFNLGRGEEYSVTEIVKAFEHALGYGLAIEPDSARMRRSDRMHLLSDNSRLSAFTGWKPVVSLAEGISTLVDPALRKRK